MRKIVIGMNAGMAGPDEWEFLEFPDEITTEELDDYAWQCAKDHAEMYGIYPLNEYDDLSDEELDSGEYSEDIGGWWEDYDPKLHDKYSMTGTPVWQQY